VFKFGVKMSKIGNFDGLNVAGRTLPRHDDHTSPIDERVPHTWSHCHHENFHLRSGQDYSKNQEKSPSPPSLMSLVGADIVRCESRVDHIASYLQLHPEWTDIETLHPDIPPFFIVNTQVIPLPPCFPPSFLHFLRFQKISRPHFSPLLTMVKDGPW
jgi:hypothetical protein